MWGLIPKDEIIGLRLAKVCSGDGVTPLFDFSACFYARKIQGRLLVGKQSCRSTMRRRPIGDVLFRLGGDIVVDSVGI